MCVRFCVGSCSCSLVLCMLSYFVILFFVVCYILVMRMFSFCFVCSIVELYRRESGV